MRRLLPALALIVVLASCAPTTRPAEPTPEPTPDGIAVWSGWEPPAESGLVLESTDFDAEGEFPESIELSFKCDGANIRPELHWAGAPDGTETFVVTFTYDGSPRDRWIAFDIPASTTSLAAGEELPLLGRSSLNSTDFLGPCSLKGERFRLWFTVYALDTTLGLDNGSTMEQVRAAGEGHVLAAAELGGYRTGPTD